MAVTLRFIYITFKWPDALIKSKHRVEYTQENFVASRTPARKNGKLENFSTKIYQY